MLWALGGFLGMGVAFLYYWPVLLALISQAAPPKLNATMMGGVFLSFFAGSVIAGWVGSFYDQMSPAKFWSIDAAIGIVGGRDGFGAGEAVDQSVGRTRGGLTHVSRQDRSWNI